MKFVLVFPRVLIYRINVKLDMFYNIIKKHFVPLQRFKEYKIDKDCFR